MRLDYFGRQTVAPVITSFIVVARLVKENHGIFELRLREHSRGYPPIPSEL